ncbi:MAG: ATP-binding cassette domain-containing protein [Parcubacteria group bacterium]|nr:ATP-binding cassette domain-containing protein [Parcubacteria group bacterium]
MERLQPVLEYIKEARDFGLSNKQILDSLVKAGWGFEDIFEIILDYPEKAVLADKPEGIIFVENLNKSFGRIQALKDVSFAVGKGSVTALLGPNGAGKTTLIRILTTLLKPDSGKVLVSSFDVVKNPQAVRSRIGLAGQNAALDEILTGRENLDLVGRLYHLSGAETQKRIQELLHQFDLLDAAERIVKTYSGGMRKRLDLAASLIAEPPILFLDEPTNGLDPRSRAGLWRTIEDLAKRGTTILLTTQYLEEADHLADRIIVIDHGRIIVQGTADELKKKIGREMTLRQPTLNDVFLALTGHGTEEFRT